MKDAFKRAGMVVVAGMLGLSLVACGGGDAKDADAAVEEVAVEEQEPSWSPVVTLGAGSTQLHLDNQLGFDVKAVYLKPSESSEWPKDLTFENLSVAKGDLFEVDFTPISADTPYDVWFTAADGTGYQAKQVTFKDLGEGEIVVKTADGVTFFEYVDAAGSKVSTKEAALAIKAAEDAAAEEARLQAEAEAEAEAAAAAAAEEEYWDYYEDDYYYEEDYSWDGGYGYDDGGVSQSEDGCLTDLL